MPTVEQKVVVRGEDARVRLQEIGGAMDAALADIRVVLRMHGEDGVRECFLYGLSLSQ